MDTPISETVAGCTGPAQVWDQCRGYPSPERVSGHNPSPLTQKLSPIDIYWQMKNYFFSNGVSLGMQTTFNARSCAHICCIKQSIFNT